MENSSATYHRSTSYERRRMPGGALEWDNRPDPFKVYPEVESEELPAPSDFPSPGLWELADGTKHESSGALDRSTLARVLMMAYGLTARSRQGREWFYFRSAASAGALYPTELYLGAGRVDGLANGWYHYAGRRPALVRLRPSDHAAETGRALGRPWEKIAAVFILTGIFFRSAWKYHRRAFRYVLLDAGHVAENLCLALESEGLSFELSYDFDDARVEHLLGSDPEREAALAAVIVHLPSGVEARSPGGQPPLPPAEGLLQASRVAVRESVPGEILSICRAGRNIPARPGPVGPMSALLGASPAEWVSFETGRPASAELSAPEAVLRRRSRRNFVPETLDHRRCTRLLDLVRMRSQTPCGPGNPGASCVAAGVLLNAVEGLADGFHLLDIQNPRLGRIRAGRFTADMAEVCLDQRWLARAGIHFLFLADLPRLDDVWGARGYRYAMLEAGRLGQTVYLGATALGLGACGIGALYDGEARDLLGLGGGSALLYLVAAGRVRRL